MDWRWIRRLFKLVMVAKARAMLYLCTSLSLCKQGLDWREEANDRGEAAIGVRRMSSEGRLAVRLMGLLSRILGCSEALATGQQARGELGRGQRSPIFYLWEPGLLTQ